MAVLVFAGAACSTVAVAVLGQLFLDVAVEVDVLVILVIGLLEGGGYVLRARGQHARGDTQKPRLEGLQNALKYFTADG